MRTCMDEMMVVLCIVVSREEWIGWVAPTGCYYTSLFIIIKIPSCDRELMLSTTTLPSISYYLLSSV